MSVLAGAGYARRNSPIGDWRSQACGSGFSTHVSIPRSGSGPQNATNLPETPSRASDTDLQNVQNSCPRVTRSRRNAAILPETSRRYSETVLHNVKNSPLSARRPASGKLRNPSGNSPQGALLPESVLHNVKNSLLSARRPASRKLRNPSRNSPRGALLPESVLHNVKNSLFAVRGSAVRKTAQSFPKLVAGPGVLAPLPGRIRVCARVRWLRSLHSLHHRLPSFDPSGRRLRFHPFESQPPRFTPASRQLPCFAPSGRRMPCLASSGRRLPSFVRSVRGGLEFPRLRAPETGAEINLATLPPLR
jgi:hypothetical protein